MGNDSSIDQIVAEAAARIHLKTKAERIAIIKAAIEKVKEETEKRWRDREQVLTNHIEWLKSRAAHGTSDVADARDCTCMADPYCKVHGNVPKPAHASEPYKHEYAEHLPETDAAAHASDEEQQEGHPQEYGDSN